jgi:hypothetical protein
MFINIYITYVFNQTVLPLCVVSCVVPMAAETRELLPDPTAPTTATSSPRLTYHTTHPHPLFHATSQTQGLQTLDCLDILPFTPLCLTLISSPRSVAVSPCPPSHAKSPLILSPTSLPRSPSSSASSSGSSKNRWKRVRAT